MVSWFTQQVYTPKQIARLARERQGLILNLSPDDPGRLTSTRFLLAGVLERPDAPELEHDPGFPTNLLDMYAIHGNETWVIPDTSVEMVTVRPVVASAQVHLPHQTV